MNNANAMMARGNTDGIAFYCPTGKQKGEMVLATIDVYEQCRDFSEPDALIMSISPSDMVAGTGLQETSSRTFTDINTAASVVKVQSLFAGYAITFGLTIQKDAMSRKLDELNEGVKYEPSPSADGWDEIRIADRAGKMVPTFTVIITYRSNSNEIIAQDIAPNCEFMLQQQGAMAAGQIYNRAIQFMPQPIGDDIGTRVIRRRRSGS
jgi:hypothetical protein